MSTSIRSNKELSALTRSEQGILVLFYAAWCPFCRRFLPVYENLSLPKDQSCFRVEVDDIDGCEDKFDIDVVPTVIYFKNGKITKRLDGKPGRGLDERQLLTLVDSCGLRKSNI